MKLVVTIFDDYLLEIGFGNRWRILNNPFGLQRAFCANVDAVLASQTSTVFVFLAFITFICVCMLMPWYTPCVPVEARWQLAGVSSVLPRAFQGLSGLVAKSAIVS